MLLRCIVNKSERSEKTPSEYVRDVQWTFKKMLDPQQKKRVESFVKSTIDLPPTF